MPFTEKLFYHKIGNTTSTNLMGKPMIKTKTNGLIQFFVLLLMTYVEAQARRSLHQRHLILWDER